MNKRILSLILCLCLVLTSCSNNKNKLSEVDTDVEKKDLVKNDLYELSALKSDNQGIDETTSFQLTSKQEINKNYIKNNLHIIPNQEYKIEKVTSTIFNIIPLAKLESNKIYQVKLNDETHDYSWAFQTKKKLEVQNTVPGDGSSYVPVNSGIEMYFSLSNLDKIDNYFEINPKVKGKFIQNNNSVVFVPEALVGGTRYTVTIKKGFGVKDNEQKLEEDYVFSFQIEGNVNSKMYFDKVMTNIYEKNVKIIDTFVDKSFNEKEFNIKIYKYKNVEAFSKNVMHLADKGEFIENITSDNNLVEMNTISQKPFNTKVSYIEKALFELPEDLSKGYYLLEFNVDGVDEKFYHFLQINDMLIYNAYFDNQILIYSADGKTSNGLKDAEVILNDEVLGYTDKNGILLCEKKAETYKNKIMFMTVKKDGYNDFIYAESNLFKYHYFYPKSDNKNKFLYYLDTDRPVYLPNDKVNVWGFIRNKDGKPIKKVKVELIESETDLVLESKYVDLTDIGTYQAEFALNNITSDYCLIKIYDNELLIDTKSISISEYTKPIYTINGEFDKKYVYSKEELEYKINAKFFDGNPVSNQDLKIETYNYNGEFVEYEAMNSVITLDENGESVIKVNSNVKTNSWRPITIGINCSNNAAEDKVIQHYNSFEIFPKHKMLEINSNENNKKSLDILFHKLDNKNYKPMDYTSYEKLRGKPLDESIYVKIIESYYDKVKIGEHYDFINKVNVIDYNYNLIENVVYAENVNTVNGIANIEIPNYRTDRRYEVTAFYDDGDGGIYETANISGSAYYYEQLYYTFETTDNKVKFRMNEEVNINLMFNNSDVENVENDKLILLLMREGLTDYKVLDNTNAQFIFDEKHLPNVMTRGVYIKNGYMYPVEYGNSLFFDKTQRKIYFDVTTDKESYSPGEEVVLNIKAKDENNKPCVADVNISVVDEAYFALFYKNVDTLESLYKYSWDDGLVTTFLSNIDLSVDASSAERGGGGGEPYSAFREKFEDTNVFKTVRTDKNGNASMKFKLADNLTTWRITYQAISDNLYAGSGTKNITVNLPFYVDIILGKEYLKEDKIYVSLRSFGSEAKRSEEVNYKVVIKDKKSGKETEYTKSGIIGKYTNLYLDKLNEGDYEIYAYASYKDYKDGIKEEFKVVDSTIYFNNTNYYKLNKDTVLDKVYSNPVITLFNESESDFYNSLDKISSSYGKRIDQTVCSMLATKYINEYFKTNLHYDESQLLREIDKYEGIDGYKLLPYVASDVEITAKLVNSIDNEYLNIKAKTYFNSVLDSNEYSEKIPAALWGLSNYKEPVLLTVYDLLEKEELKAREKIYLMLALTELGDYEVAKKYYDEFVKNNLKVHGNYLYFDNNLNETDNYELTALFSILGVKLKDFNNSDKLFKYVYNNPSKYTLCNFEQLIYIMNRDIMNLNEIKDLFGEVTVTIDGAKKTYKLKLFDRESFAVEKEKISDVKFSNIKGSIACKVNALGNKDNLDKNKTDDISLNVTYKLNNKIMEILECKQSDIVTVSIFPSYSSDIEKGYYEITYVVPSGFRYINMEGHYNPLVEVDGQKLKFLIYYDKVNFAPEPIHFNIQAAQIGEYTIDYVVIKECMESKLNYTNKSALTVH